MNATVRPGGFALSPAEPLLNGISWYGFGLVALLFGVWSLQWVIKPARMIMFGGPSDLILAWLSFWAAMLVGGASLFVVVVVVLNGAVRAGLNRAWVVVPSAFAGSLVAASVSEIAGSAPVGLGLTASGFAGANFWADWAMAIAVGYLVLLRVRAAREHARRLELQHKTLGNRQTEAQLRVLQAQIEPHFLFNTLSNIRRLCQQDITQGRAMLAQLTRYLHAALPKIRRDHASLADEIELTEAYLALQKIRMGDRLQVLMEVPDAYLAAAVPPMMLVTLAENAIKHGVAPLPEGGLICIRAARDGDSLRLSVSDTGRGFVAESGSGVGLSNIRARLAALHGSSASLMLQANLPRGMLASITLPWRIQEPAR